MSAEGNKLTVDIPLGQDSHSVTDQTQGNWNGITGRIELQAQWKKLNIKGITVKVDSIEIALPDRWERGRFVKDDKVVELCVASSMRRQGIRQARRW